MLCMAVWVRDLDGSGRRADLSTVKVVMLQLGQIHLNLRVECSLMSPTHSLGQPST